MNKELKNLIKSIFIIIFLLLILDFTSGQILKHYIKTSTDTKQLYCFNTNDIADVVIVGSSRASHHYVSSIIEDSLGFDVFNAGMDGYGLTLLYPVVEAIYTNSNPKIIILELLPTDLTSSLNDRISLLKPYGENISSVDSIATILDSNYKYKKFSSLFRMNGDFVFKSIQAKCRPYNNNLKGYEPLSSNESIVLESIEPYPESIDSLALGCLDRIVEMANQHGTLLVICISPELKIRTGQNPIEQYCMNNSIVFLDNSRVNDIISNHEYFRDAWHLNDVGSTKYSQIFSSQLKSLIESY